ncbi:unnamed protein product [Parnassius mnemosyne]|uniref:PiggyBac transposable element-derived protein domain-containing protein n=1 Tax=Parnassius mnemosyne TaxID=213953 RepID=A0AAV1K9K4_9NEOP
MDDEAIENQRNLDVSEFEDDDGDDDIDDVDYRPQGRNRQSDNSAESSSDFEGELTVSSPAISNSFVTRGRSLQRRGGRRGRRISSISRASSRRASSSRGRLYQQVEAEDNEDIGNDDGQFGGWKEKDFNPDIIPFMQPSYLPLNDKEFCKIDYFRRYVNDELMKIIVDRSNEMYLSRNGQFLNLTLPECYIFIAINLAMSCIGYPILRMYWQHKFRVAFVADHMSRNRFFILRNSLKLVNDNDFSAEDKSKDKLWKVRPLIKEILKGCHSIPKDQKLSIDKMIIPFTGACGMKQYCPGKPNPTGLKTFVLANPTGEVCDFDIYQGATTYPSYADTSFGLGEKAVLALTEDLLLGHIIYCDRYFTTETLIVELKNRGLMCSGTLMKNRVPKSARLILKEDKDLKKAGRGSCQVLVNDEKNIAITKWFDNKPVTFLSTVHAAQTSDTCQRWCKQNKVYVTVPRPEVVKQYNSNMGGVDLADRLLAVAPSRYRTRKWTTRFIAHMFDLATTNSWLNYKAKELRKNVPVKKIQGEATEEF